MLLIFDLSLREKAVESGMVILKLWSVVTNQEVRLFILACAHIHVSCSIVGGKVQCKNVHIYHKFEHKLHRFDMCRRSRKIKHTVSLQLQLSTNHYLLRLV